MKMVNIGKKYKKLLRNAGTIAKRLEEVASNGTNPFRSISA